MPKVIIGKFGPSARQILDAALAVAQGPKMELVVRSMPKGATVFGECVRLCEAAARDYHVMEAAG